MVFLLNFIKYFFDSSRYALDGVDCMVFNYLLSNSTYLVFIVLTIDIYCLIN